jgi:hypothetical protein
MDSVAGKGILSVSQYNSSALLPLRSTSTVLSESCVSVNPKFDLLQVAVWECGGANIQNAVTANGRADLPPPQGPNACHLRRQCSSQAVQPRPGIGTFRIRKKGRWG